MQPSRGVLRILYLLAIAMLIDSFIELAIGVYPLRPGEARWRFGLVGLLFGRSTALLLADGLLIAAAVGLAHRGVLRFLSVLHAVVAVALAGLVPLFLLDAVEVRRAVVVPARRALDLTAGRAVVVAVLLVILCSWAAWVLWRGTALQSRRKESDLMMLRPEPR